MNQLASVYLLAFTIQHGEHKVLSDDIVKFTMRYITVTHDYANHTIFLLPELDQEAGIFEKAWLVFSMDREP